MPVSLAVILAAGVMIACGVYLLLERTLTRVLMGFVLAGNGVNLLFLVASGRPGLPPFEGTAPAGEMTDPLPYAMVLTAIVIAMGIAAFVIALSYRAWQLFGHDEVPDDVEDRRVLRRTRRRGSNDRIPRAGSLSEEHRRGALTTAQHSSVEADDEDEDLDEVDPVGSDLTSDEDVPPDHTESDENPDPTDEQRAGGDR